MEKENIRFNKQGIPVKIREGHLTQGGHYRGLHSHPAVEIILVGSGVLQCYIGGESISVQEGQILFVNSNMGHRLTSKNAHITYFQIDTSHYTDRQQSDRSPIYEFILSSRAKPYALFSVDSELGDILSKIAGRYNNARPYNHWYLTAHIYELVAFMYASALIALPAGNINVEKIASVVRFLDANYKLPLTLSDISSATGYNKHTLCHMFKNVTGKTIFDYINFLRIRCAIEKLKQKDVGILQVATECGFTSASYFNRVFKSEMGCAPTAYRKYIF